MKVRYLNNEGEGFAGIKEVEDGTTLSAFFNQQFEDSNPDEYTIRVNSEAYEAEYVLQEGDRVTISPRNISGA